MKNITFKRVKTATYAYRQRGASLLEGIAYLGIAAIVVIGAVSLMRNAFSGAQTNSLLENIVGIRTNVRKLNMGQGGYAGATNLNLYSARAFPDSIVITDTTTGAAANTWGGTITVAPTATNAQFTITYTQIPQDVCINILSGATGWASIKVGTSTAITSFPISPSTASTNCGSSNTIVWTSD